MLHTDDPLTVNPCCCIFILKMGVKGWALLDVLHCFSPTCTIVFQILGTPNLPFLVGLIVCLAVVKIKMAMVFPIPRFAPPSNGLIAKKYSSWCSPYGMEAKVRDVILILSQLGRR